MLKRLFSVVLVLGLTFMVASPVLADVDPQPGDITGPFDYSTGLLKGQPFPTVEPTRADAIAFTGEVQGFAKIADICADERSRSRAYFNPGIMFPGAIFWALQEMETVCPSPYTFEVVTAHFYAVTSGAAGLASMHAEVWSVDDTDPACLVPDAVIWTGPTMTYNIPAGVAGLYFELPLATSPYDIACVDGPYFIAVVAGAQESGVELSGWWSDYEVPPQYCTYYWNVITGLPTDFAGYWYDPDYNDSWDMNLFSSGRASGENACHEPGICGWELKHCVWETYTFYNFAMPSTSGTRDFIWQQWEAATPCTVWQVDQYMGGVNAGDPGLRISLYDDNNGFPGNEIVGQDFPTSAIPAGGWVSATFPADAPVVIQPGKYYVFIDRASWATDADTLGVGLDDAPNCPLDYTCYTGFRDNTGADMYVCDMYGAGSGNEFELFCEIYLCCAKPKTCEPGATAPDTWFTHAHDYGRTSRSTMGVGEPCDIELVWKANTTVSDLSFNNVIVAGQQVYASDNAALNCYDLSTGALLFTHGPGLPKTDGSMRGNPTVSGGYVYSGGGGGNVMSFYCLDVNASIVAGIGVERWWRGLNSHGGGAGDMLCGDQRFGVSVVLNAPPVEPYDGEIVVFGDQGGCLWALNTADGTNYGGWGTNPVTFPDGGPIFHSPAYDGGENLYVATVGGSIYEVDAATGNINWAYDDPDGDAFYSGCSYEDGFVYAATFGGQDAGGAIVGNPKRFKLDASDGSEVWVYEQGSVLYASPTIGHKKVYFGLSNPSVGILMVNKETGVAEYNFNINGVGMVPNPVTLTADCYLFAGDAAGKWSLLNAQTMTREWSRQFDDYVYGTALAYDEDSLRNVAVMSIWSDICTGYSYGAVFCWNLDAEPRPMMEQLVYEVTVPVPLGSGMINDEVAADVFENLAGCADLTITGTAVGDYPPSMAAPMTPKVTKVSRVHAQAAEETATRMISTDYLSFFDSEGNLTKRGLMADKSSLPAAPMDEELVGERHRKARFEQTKQRAMDLAAGTAALQRTQNVRDETGTAHPATYAGGSTGGFMFDVDGAGLARGIDYEYIEWTHDDPDFYPEDNTGQCHLAVWGYDKPFLDVNIVGGCPFEWYDAMWLNTYDMVHLEQVSNFGATGDGFGYGLDWDDGINDIPIYDGGFFILQRGGQYFQADFYDWDRRFLPDPAPISGVCGFDYAWDYPLGRSMVIDCPQGGPNWPELNVDYMDLLGEFVISNFIDTVEIDATAIGVKIYQVEISFYDFDHGYGDMKLFHYKVVNRGDALIEDLIAGMFHDFDLQPAPASNAAAVVPEVGGVAVWDSSSPSIALGHVVMPGSLSLDNSCEIDGVDFYALWAVVNEWNIYDGNCVAAGGPCCLNPAQAGTPEEASNVVACFDYYWPGYGYDPNPNNYNDKSDFFAWPQFDLDPEGEAHMYAALIGVDATTNDKGVIKDGIRSMAYRANKISGFARGDVNDDGCIDASDLAYLYAWLNGAVIPIFPHDDNGDVNCVSVPDGLTDAADLAYLLDYLMQGPAPEGKWRFTIMP